jgi:hypothetical protein
VTWFRDWRHIEWVGIPAREEPPVSRYPAARWRPVPVGSNDPPITPVLVILHVSAVETPSLFGYFDGPSGGIESHFYIAYDGTVEQYRDTNREADANFQANSWVADGRRLGAISIETEGLAGGTWTAQQLAAIKALLTWLHREHGIPLRLATGVHGTGVGWHVMFGAGPLTYSWSNAAGKVCPGPRRIQQFHTELLPWMQNPTPPHVEDDDMANIDSISDAAAEKIGKAFAVAFHNQLIGHGPDTFGQALEAVKVAADKANGKA